MVYKQKCYSWNSLTYIHLFLLAFCKVDLYIPKPIFCAEACLLCNRFSSSVQSIDLALQYQNKSKKIIFNEYQNVK